MYECLIKAQRFFIHNCELHCMSFGKGFIENDDFTAAMQMKLHVCLLPRQIDTI